MELTLARQAGSQVNVICDGQPSHSFDLWAHIPNKERGLPQPLDDPVTYGREIFKAIFSTGTPARNALDLELRGMPGRILIVADDDDLDAIPWEYAYGPDGYLVLECHFLRGLPTEQRTHPPSLEDTGLHIIAVPSSPLDKDVPPLNIEGEWLRLKENIEQVSYAISLERVRPPSIEQVRALLANQRHRVVHFMGHGGQHETGAILCFEKDNGDLDPVTARQFVLRVRGTVFLVTLNACVSATPGETPFSNLAAALVRQKIPYALGMRLSIEDEDARAFSRTFYNDLARGSSVEEALLQARLTLANSPHRWVVGVPVLYTALATPVAGFTRLAGMPTVKEHQPHIEVTALPRAEGAFQGRIDELKQLGNDLTGDSRPRIVTIHGGGGQGKTALAREAVERFAYAWPGGIWATTLENLPSREVFVNDLARFLGIDTQKVLDPNEVERLMLAQLTLHRTLIVLDNAETLVDAVEANDVAAIELAQCIKPLPSTSVSLLVTSRVQLQWSGEVSHELGGLSPKEGADLFRQSAPQRTNEIESALVEKLSERLEGHPLSLRLLGGAFNASAISLHAFVEECEEQLVKAENKYVGEEHRHRTLYACLETSVRYLDANLRSLLSGLWVFHAPFLPQTATAIFDPETEDTEDTPSPIRKHLHTLWQRGLLTREKVTVRDGTLLFYYLLPTTRPYVEHHLEQAYEREMLLAWFGAVYSQLAGFLFDELNSSAAAVAIAQQAREDFEQGLEHVAGVEQGYYLLYWAWIQQRVGNPRHGLRLLEHALEITQGQDRRLEAATLSNMAEMYRAMGQPQEALHLCQQALPIIREVGDRALEAATLNNMALVYRATGLLQEALHLYLKALPIIREVRDRAEEATILSNMAATYRTIGQPQEALRLYEQALPIMREVGNRAGEAATLSNIALVYQNIGQSQEALRLYEQALSIMREVGNRADEAATLSNMAGVYQTTGQPQEALRLYQQALPTMHEVGNRAGEAATLSNMAGTYRTIGQPQEALKLYEQALPIRREMGDRAGEAATLSNMALVYQNTGQSQEALRLYEQALPIRREVGDQAGEVATLNGLAYLFRGMHRYTEALAAFEQSITLARQIVYPTAEVSGLAGMAALLHRHLDRTEDAITHMEQAIAVLVKTGLPQDAAGHTIEDLQRFLQAMRTGRAQAGGSATMSSAHIQENLPFDAELLSRSVAAIVGGPPEKMEHMQYLATLAAQATDEQMKLLINTIQLALFSSDLSQLGQQLSGVYRQAWETIVAGVKMEGVSSP